jgi:hypothetical protein
VGSGTASKLQSQSKPAFSQLIGKLDRNAKGTPGLCRIEIRHVLRESKSHPQFPHFWEGLRGWWRLEENLRQSWEGVKRQAAGQGGSARQSVTQCFWSFPAGQPIASALLQYRHYQKSISKMKETKLIISIKPLHAIFSEAKITGRDDKFRLTK